MTSWRFKCPHGHTGWKPINGHFWCPHCAANWDGADPAFERVRDAKTGDRLDREAVRELEQQLRRSGGTPA